MTTQIAIVNGATRFKLVTGEKNIRVNVKEIARKGQKLDDLIQLTAMSIANHIDQFGDVTLADHLYNNMPKGSRRLALAEWFNKYGMVSVITKDEKEKDSKLKDRVFRINRSKKVDLEGGNKEPWYDCKQEKDADEAFDFEAQLKRLMGRLEKAQKDNKEIKCDPALLNAIRTAWTSKAVVSE